jgi:hypothetical protein
MQIEPQSLKAEEARQREGKVHSYNQIPPSPRIYI